MLRESGERWSKGSRGRGRAEEDDQEEEEEEEEEEGQQRIKKRSSRSSRSSSSTHPEFSHITQEMSSCQFILSSRGPLPSLPDSDPARPESPGQSIRTLPTRNDRRLSLH